MFSLIYEHVAHQDNSLIYFACESRSLYPPLKQKDAIETIYIALHKEMSEKHI